MYIHIKHTTTTNANKGDPRGSRPGIVARADSLTARRRENTVGVNMVLA